MHLHKLLPERRSLYFIIGRRNSWCVRDSHTPKPNDLNDRIQFHLRVLCCAVYIDICRATQKINWKSRIIIFKLINKFSICQKFFSSSAYAHPIRPDAIHPIPNKNRSRTVLDDTHAFPHGACIECSTRISRSDNVNLFHNIVSTHPHMSRSAAHVSGVRATPKPPKPCSENIYAFFHGRRVVFSFVSTISGAKFIFALLKEEIRWQRVWQQASWMELTIADSFTRQLDSNVG